MSRFTSIVFFTIFSTQAHSDNTKEAVITGERYFGFTGQEAHILLDSEKCIVASRGDSSNGSFSITLTCGSRTQVLWDMNQLKYDDLSFDDPKFSLDWAGDEDGDGKIDLTMDLSAKYSCSKVVKFLSSISDEGRIVGVVGSPTVECGC